MKFIAQGGVSTKNTPHNSLNAFLLALNIKGLAGIAVDVHLTKDDKVVVLDQSYVDHISNAVGNISNFTLTQLNQLNFGNRLKRHTIVTLQELLSLFGDKNKVLVIQLTDQKTPKQNKILIDKVVQLLNEYPNVQTYLKSSKKDMILYLNSLNRKLSIGLTISNTNINFEPYQLDFYSLMTPELLNQSFIEEVERQQRFIMIENVDTLKQFERIETQVKGLHMEIYIISNRFLL